jgi:hypothetical protein
MDFNFNFYYINLIIKLNYYSFHLYFSPPILAYLSFMLLAGWPHPVKESMAPSPTTTNEIKKGI